MRWYIYASAPVGSSRRFSARLVQQGLRRLQLTLWNVYNFFVSYANIDGLDPRERPEGEPPELDRWLLSELNALTERVTTGLDDYDPTVAARAIEGFVDDLSNWYVRRSRRRFWRGVSGADADKRSAYFTLHTALTTLARLLAPFTPFLAEELWGNLAHSLDGDAPESVHLADWPEPVPLVPGGDVFIDESLNAETQLVKRVASMGRAARAKASIKVRQPLAEVLVRPRDASEADVLERHQALLLEELNVKALNTLEDEAGIVTFEVKPNLPVLGPRLGREVGAVRSALGALDAEEVAAAVRAGQTVTVAGHDLAPEDFLVELRERDGYAVVSEAGYTVGVATTITDELADEGIARELVRHIQDLRREADFELSDRITTWCAGGETVARVLAAHGDYVKGETLSVELFTEAPPQGRAADGVHARRRRGGRGRAAEGRMTAPKAILFDLDDTLLDMYSAMHSSWQEICAEVAPRLGADAASLRETIRRESAIFWADEEAVAEYRVRPLDSRTCIVRLALLSEGLDESPAEEIARDSLRGYLERVAPFDDSIATLEALRAQGYRLGMVTNGSSDTQREKIGRWNLEPYFDEIVIESEFGRGKPDPGGVRAGARRDGGGPGRGLDGGRQPLRRHRRGARRGHPQRLDPPRPAAVSRRSARPPRSAYRELPGAARCPRRSPGVARPAESHRRGSPLTPLSRLLRYRSRPLSVSPEGATRCRT